MTYPYYVAVISTTIHFIVFMSILLVTQNVKISSSITSVVHATLSSIMTFSVFLIYIENNYVDRDILKVMGGISAGYFSTDFIALLFTKDFSKSERIEYIIHHIIAFSMIYVVTSTSINCEILIMLTPFTEVSSLLANSYILLAHFLPEYTRLQLFTGIMMIITFVLTRFILVPYGYYYDYAHIYESVDNAFIINSIFVPFMILNIYWCDKIFDNIKIFLELRKTKN